MERAGGESGEGSWKIFNQRTLAHPPLPIPIGATKGAAESPEKIAPFLLVPLSIRAKKVGAILVWVSEELLKFGVV